MKEKSYQYLTMRRSSTTEGGNVLFKPPPVVTAEDGHVKTIKEIEDRRDSGRSST